MTTFEVEFEFWEKEVTRTQIRRVWRLRNHLNNVFGQKFVHGDGSVTEHCRDAASKCPQSLAGHDEHFFCVVQGPSDSIVNYLSLRHEFLMNNALIVEKTNLHVFYF
jgi:hypothetical protein